MLTNEAESSNNVTWGRVPTYPSPPGFHQTICPSWPSPKWTTKHNCHRIRAAAALPRFSVGTLARRLMLPKVMVWINAHECFLQKKFYMTWNEAKVYCILLDVLCIQILRPLDAWTPYCKSLYKSWSQRWFFVQILVVKLEKILYLFNR